MGVRHSGYNAGTNWWVNYFGAGFNGELRRTISDHKYQTGFIRMGYGCRHYRFKDLVINSLVSTVDHGTQTIPISDTHWTTANGGQIRQGELYATGGWASITSKQTFTAPLKVT